MRAFNNKIDERSVIPRHTLQNSSGKEVNFDFHKWAAVQNYNFLKAHRHNYYEIVVLEKGKAKHEIDFTTYYSSERSVHFVAPDNVHLILREKESTGYTLLFTSALFSEELIDQLPFFKPNPILHLNKQAFEKITEISRLIYTEHTNEKTFSDRIIKSLMETLILQLIREYENTICEEFNSKVPLHILSFKKMVKENYRNHFSVEAYADNLGITAKHLIELCKKHTGKTALSYIRSHIIIEAKRLLFHSNSSIKEIAYSLNFNDPANFSKYFKAHTGYSPAAYRERVR